MLLVDFSPSERIDACLHVDCRSFFDPAMVGQPHDGRHESVQAAMLKTKKMKGKIVVDFLD
eukprot:7239336-Heterocapsa_arctica.AAC.1